MAKQKKVFQARPLKAPNPSCLSPRLVRKFLFTSDPLPHTLFEQCPKFHGFFHGFPKRSCTLLTSIDIYRFCQPFWGPLAAILDIAAWQGVSEYPLHSQPDIPFFFSLHHNLYSKRRVALINKPILQK